MCCSMLIKRSWRTEAKLFLQMSFVGAVHTELPAALAPLAFLLSGGASASSSSNSAAFTCPICYRKCPDLGRLQNHIKYHQRYQRSCNVCPVCGRKVQSPSHLRVHLRTHTGEKPFKCSILNCSYRASDPSNLTKHVKKKHPWIQAIMYLIREKSRLRNFICRSVE